MLYNCDLKILIPKTGFLDIMGLHNVNHRPKDVLCDNNNNKKHTDVSSRRQSLRGVSCGKRQAQTDAHVHSPHSNKEPIVGSTCLRKAPVCS